jgi:hypothetical protein
MSNHEWIRAQAQEGHTVEAELVRVKAKHEPTLATKYDRASSELAKLDKLRETAQTLPGEIYDSEVVLDDLWITAKAEVQNFKEENDRAEKDRKSFALMHGLPRAPITPEPVQNSMVLGLFGGIETMVNAGFLNNASMVAGPAQAFVASGLISLTNIAASTAAGYFIVRPLSYGLHTAEPDHPPFKLKRLAAGIGLSGFVGIMGLFHLTVGLIRAQETLHHIEHSIPRYLEIFTTPEALFLVIVGGVLSAVSMKKGMTAFDDPYPGYGEKGRAVQRVRDHLLARCDELKDEISARFEEKREALKKAEKEVISKRTQFNQAVAEYLNAERTHHCSVNNAESFLRLEVSRIAHQHRIASGRGVRWIPTAALEQFVHFDHYRFKNSPVCLAIPDFSTIKTKLDRAESAALQRLTILFENATQPSDGGSL